MGVSDFVVFPPFFPFFVPKIHYSLSYGNDFHWNASFPLLVRTVKIHRSNCQCTFPRTFPRKRNSHPTYHEILHLFSKTTSVYLKTRPLKHTECKMNGTIRTKVNNLYRFRKRELLGKKLLFF